MKKYSSTSEDLGWSNIDYATPNAKFLDDPFSRCATSNNCGLQHEEENLELRMRGGTERQDVRHQWRRDIQDQHSAHETRHLTSACARSLLVSFVQSCIVIFTHCTPHRVAQVVRVFALISSMDEVSVTLRLWDLHSIQLPLLFILPLLSILLQSPAVPVALLLPRGLVVTLCTTPTRRWGLRTNPTPTQVMSPRTTTSWKLMSSP